MTAINLIKFDNNFNISILTLNQSICQSQSAMSAFKFAIVGIFLVSGAKAQFTGLCNQMANPLGTCDCSDTNQLWVNADCTEVNTFTKFRVESFRSYLTPITIFDFHSRASCVRPWTTLWMMRSRAARSNVLNHISLWLIRGQPQQKTGNVCPKLMRLPQFAQELFTLVKIESQTYWTLAPDLRVRLHRRQPRGGLPHRRVSMWRAAQDQPWLYSGKVRTKLNNFCEY